MSLQRFINQALSDWMKGGGPDEDIVISSRIRLARNLTDIPFPMIATREQLEKVVSKMEKILERSKDNQALGNLELLRMEDLSSLEKKVLVEKHLISPLLAEEARAGAVILSENESISIMLNEEDHLRIQCLFPGFQLEAAWTQANSIDDWLEMNVDFAFDEKRGYLTSCPTNVGTGLRASVMVHLPALVMSKQMNRILPAINQLGLVVRGIYGEGSDALGNIFQISNQITLGRSETEIIEDLGNVAMQLIEQERQARKQLLESSRVQLEDKIFRSYGILANARVIESKEAMQRLSDVRLGIDLGLIKGVSSTIMNELIVLTQPGFLQQYAGQMLSPDERDVRRAKLIRERLLTT
ncbi:ATP:guanido phosphotransferase [Caldalkalibacillus thermarum TA2.A1]|uniref:Protein-arginine kinase n=1 Tax=Caldalkalibacillus thermarum (strain TA2.A1) TaxID=986075 RepID=F5L595_CALTT|nr:protein arginine kinase [Caldalkalibacillus thermarum]EGL83493.1 ATP:guanido phosphotransferase [Caldalkalibacillus thermarum TA2.A1]